MQTFNDKKNRLIYIELDETSAEARFKGKRIGFVTTTGLQEIDARVPLRPAEITGWEVEPDFRRAGIATEMVRLLYEQLGMLLPGNRNIGIGNQNALTDEGEAAVRYCQELGYVCAFEEDSPHPEDDY